MFSSDCRNNRLQCYDRFLSFTFWRNFDQPVRYDLRTYDNIQIIATGQGDDYTTGCLLDYPYFKKYYKLITVDLTKQ